MREMYNVLPKRCFEKRITIYGLKQGLTCLRFLLFLLTFWPTGYRPKLWGGIMKREYKLTQTKAKFTDIIWDSEPISSSELVKLCEQKLSWKKSTTYTILKRLEAKWIFENSKGTRSSFIEQRRI